MIVLEGALDAVRTELALVEGERLPRLDADDPFVLHDERHTALLATEAAVRVHGPVGVDACGEPTRRLVVQVRAERVDECVGRARWHRHLTPPPRANA